MRCSQGEEKVVLVLIVIVVVVVVVPSHRRVDIIINLHTEEHQTTLLRHRRMESLLIGKTSCQTIITKMPNMMQVEIHLVLYSQIY